MSRAIDCQGSAGVLQHYYPERSGCAGMVQNQDTRGFARMIMLWHERFRQRRELCVLADDPDLLRDTGLSRYDVLQEASKPFWRG